MKQKKIFYSTDAACKLFGFTKRNFCRYILDGSGIEPMHHGASGFGVYIFGPKEMKILAQRVKQHRKYVAQSGHTGGRKRKTIQE